MAKKKTVAKKPVWTAAQIERRKLILEDSASENDTLVVTEGAAKIVADEGGEMKLRVMSDDEWQLLVRRQEEDRHQLDDMLDRLSRAEKTLLDDRVLIGAVRDTLKEVVDSIGRVEKKFTEYAARPRTLLEP